MLSKELLVESRKRPIFADVLRKNSRDKFNPYILKTKKRKNIITAKLSAHDVRTVVSELQLYKVKEGGANQASIKLRVKKISKSKNAETKMKTKKKKIKRLGKYFERSRLESVTKNTFNKPARQPVQSARDTYRDRRRSRTRQTRIKYSQSQTHGNTQQLLIQHSLSQMKLKRKLKLENGETKQEVVSETSENKKVTESRQTAVKSNQNTEVKKIVLHQTELPSKVDSCTPGKKSRKHSDHDNILEEVLSPQYQDKIEPTNNSLQLLDAEEVQAPDREHLEPTKPEKPPTTTTLYSELCKFL